MKPNAKTRKLIKNEVRLQMLERLIDAGLDEEFIVRLTRGKVYSIYLQDIDYKITLSLEFDE